MTVVPIYRLAWRHPQAEVCAACEVRGALDDDGLDRIHTRLASLERAPDAPLCGRGSEGTAMFTKTILDLLTGRRVRLDRGALRRAARDEDAV